jgi:signal transduction histidine kinase
MVKVGYTWIIFLPIVYYHFAMRFLKEEREKNTIRIAYLLGFIFLTLNWYSDYFIRGYFNYFWGQYPKAGIAHPLYLCMLLYLALRGVYKVIVKIKSESNPQAKNQIKYILASFTFYAVAAVDFIVNYDVEFYPPGFIFILISLFIIAYAIVRHRLLDIEVVIKKTLVFAGLFGFIFSIIVSVTLLVQEFIAQFIPHSRFIALAISAVIIVLLQQPVYNFLVNATNKYLFQKKYDLRKILKDFADEVLTILNLDRACKVTVEVLVKNLYLTNCAVLLLSKDETAYEIHESSGIENTNSYLSNQDSLVKYLKSKHGPALYQGYDKNLQAADDVKKDMEKIKSHLCMPLIIHNQLVGILSLGAKKSDEPYTADDVDMLTTLNKAVSIAISNARLFAQAAQYEKLATIGTIASAINHEVCNPLNNISTRMQIFRDSRRRGIYKDKTPEQVIEDAESIMQNSVKEIQRVADITAKLSSFAKPSRENKPKPIDIAQAIDDALGVVGHELEMNKIDVVKNIPQGLPCIMADEHQVQQIFFNVIRNAAQAIKEKGTITIVAEEFKDRIDIEISDTGCGIPEDKINKIFEPFYTTKEKGSGFGLSIVRELIWRNDGNISVESKMGVGTTFYLEFPKA